ncbi:protein kinase family protein [Streptomyces sp. NPDC048664]|uniref:protein kinase family protein n=1 Tax=Streptomyces sp. NPDC048664 TaxID=3154505 RepID=UPI00342DD239
MRLDSGTGDAGERGEAGRLVRHGDVSTSLAVLSDEELAALVAGATPLGAGIGGRGALLRVDGVPVFVKRVPLTDLERRPRHVHSTANVFGLPPFCQYGIGGPGFGAWRELAAHTMTTNWVLTGRFAGFPLMHHWRVLPDTPQPLHAELVDVAGAVEYWEGSPQVGERIEALRTASASVALFLEYIPYTVHDWLGARVAAGDADAACALVDRELTAVAGFLGPQGFTHFDAHFENVLTDGRRLYLADYGLAVSSRFRLSPAEREFLGRHRGYDQVYTATYLVKWLVTALYGYGAAEREAFVHACAKRAARPEGIAPVAAGLITRYAPLAAVMVDFSRRLRSQSRLTPYPYEELRRVYRSCTVSA